MEQDNPPRELDSDSNSAATSRPRRHGWIWLLLIALLAGCVAIRHERAKAAESKKPSGPPSLPVVVAKVTKGNIGVYFTGLGAVTPLNTVTVKSRVDGELTKVLYREGDLVHQGDLLAQVDPRPFEVQLEQAEGQYLKDEANLENARVDVKRYETLVAQNAAPEQQLATQRALVKQDEGTVKADQGTVDSAKLNITYSRIVAPMTGRIGLRLVDPGNMVHSSDQNGLLVITQVQPISVVFTIAEDQLPVVVRKLHAGRQLLVDAYDREMKDKVAQGRLTAVDNQIDQATGTLKLRSIFDNKDGALFPNQFVNARLLVEEKKGVVLIPTAAVQRNSQSTHVYLVKPDSTVTIRQIKLGTTEGEQSEVTEGLNEGDTIVMTGVDKLQEGTKVIPHAPGEKVEAEKSGKLEPAKKSGKGKK